MRLIKLLTSAWFGTIILAGVLAWWKDLWWELLLAYLVVFAENIHRDMTRRKKIERDLNKWARDKVG